MSAPVVVAPGAEDVDLGAVRLEQFRPMGFVSDIRCGDRLLRIGITRDGTMLQVGARMVELAPAETGSGSRYVSADGQTEVWTHGREVRLSLDGEELEGCAMADAPPPVSLRASGLGWDLAMGGGLIRFREGEAVTYLPRPEVDGAPDDGWLWAAETPEGPFSLTLTPGACADAATGLEMPFRAELTLGETRREGCASRMATELAHADWRAHEIAGQAVPEGIEVSLEFAPEDGRVAGRSGCNRYFGSFAADGGRIAFGRIGMTMMACADEAMAAERRFAEALERADRIMVGEDGQLTLLAGATVLLRARN